MGEQFGKDMILPVLLAYNRDMPGMIKGWAKEVAESRKMTEKDAEQFLARRVSYIAECEGRRFRHCCPVEDMTREPDVMDMEEWQTFGPVKGTPTGGETNREKNVSSPAREYVSAIAPPIEWDFVNLEGTEWRKGGGHMVIRHKVAEELRMAPGSNGFRELLEAKPHLRFYPIHKVDDIRMALKSGKRTTAAHYDMTDWKPEWHPLSAPNWRHPGRKSERKKAE
jgi:hypothetical protein